MKGWMKKIRAFTLLGLITLILSACGKENLTALDPKGYGSETSFNLMIITTLVMLFVFAVVMIIYTIVIIRYRRKKGEEDHIPKQVEGNKKLEMVWTIIPIFLLLIMAVPTLMATFDLADKSAADDSINIEVTGNQYWWHFNYKGKEIQTSQDLYIPTGEKVYLNMKSSDVIHSFWVPALSGKMDVNPDNENVMYLEADEEGVYWGKCAEFCGPSHSLMDFKVIAVSPDKFDKWVDDMQNVDPDKEPEGAVAQEGQELFEQKNCMSCHAVGSSSPNIGPNLTAFGNRTQLAGIKDLNKDNVVDWIMDPEEIKPGNKMTGQYPEVSEEEAGKIAEYLLQLKPTDVTPDSVSDSDEDF